VPLCEAGSPQCELFATHSLTFSSAHRHSVPTCVPNMQILYPGILYLPASPDLCSLPQNTLKQPAVPLAVRCSHNNDDLTLKQLCH
jgi:hypothetical protein